MVLWHAFLYDRYHPPRHTPSHATVDDVSLPSDTEGGETYLTLTGDITRFSLLCRGSGCIRVSWTLAAFAVTE